MRFGGTIIAGSFLFCTPALADSDGYFCLGPGYLAVETFQSGFVQNAAETTYDGHKLSIVRPSESPESIVSVFEISLPSFQTHHMDCDPHQVKIYGFDSGYSVDLTSGAVEDLVDPAFDRTRPLGNLRRSIEGGGKTHAKTVTLTDWSDVTAYELHIFGYMVSDQSEAYSPIQHHTVSRIVRFDRQRGHVTGTYILFSDAQLETID